MAPIIPFPPGDRIAAVVVEAAMLTPEIRGIVLAAADGAALPAAEPGAHVEVRLPDGIVRHYSIVERVADGSTYRIAVLREPRSRGGSAYLVERLAPGDALDVSTPRNHFALDEHASEYMLIAGGIGITPILPMARRLDALGKSFTLLYLARSRERMALRDAIECGPLRENTRLHCSEQHGEADLRTLLGVPRAGAQVYVCGPGRLIDGVLDAARDWPAGAVRFERFGAAAVPREPEAGAQAFEVELARTGRRFAVPAGRSILDVLRDERIAVDSVCGEGVCGTCAVTLLDGEAEHRDCLQTDAERRANNLIYICVSRAKSSRLVLDL
ncbi:ferredoxin [Burkholderia aenigmatica]|uniref:Ferredoxin n=1 Tax=Burkholderia aenigmatica TaxID=2015348 RepID=A0A6P2HR05_9BURK|nr:MULTISPECIES: PDR/VanB family oxidoreductase [Burkholderia]VWB19383.1 ferredoxin [Burkholderia aenigmatica]